MKKKKIIFYSLMFLPLIVVLIALHFLPERIPAHYDFNNQVTRWGSKYETLIFPVITVLFGYFMLGMAKFSSKQEENGSNNENVCIVAGIVSLTLFNAMTVISCMLISIRLKIFLQLHLILINFYLDCLVLQ